MDNTPIKKFLEAGVQFTEMSRKQAESIVKSLVASGEVRRTEAEQMVSTLIERGKQTSEKIAAAVQREVEKQIAAMSERFDEIEDRVEALTAQLRGQQPARKSAAKKTTAKKTTKKSPAKKTSAKKTSAKKTSAKKTSAKKAVGSSGVRKVSAARQR